MRTPVASITACCRSPILTVEACGDFAWHSRGLPAITLMPELYFALVVALSLITKLVDQFSHGPCRRQDPGRAPSQPAFRIGCASLEGD
jgi:hypothetical protein